MEYVLKHMIDSSKFYITYLSSKLVNPKHFSSLSSNLYGQPVTIIIPHFCTKFLKFTLCLHKHIHNNLNTLFTRKQIARISESLFTNISHKYFLYIFKYLKKWIDTIQLSLHYFKQAKYHAHIWSSESRVTWLLLYCIWIYFLQK